MAVCVQSDWTPTSESQDLLQHLGKIMDWDEGGGGKVEFALHELN